MTVDSVLDALKKLKEISKVSPDEFFSDWKLHASALWYFYTLIQGLLDLTGKLIVKKGFRQPTSYADYIYVLGENGIIPKDKIKNFVKMAKFRNVLAHTYSSINLVLIFEFLKKNLCDVEEFPRILVKELREG